MVQSCSEAILYRTKSCARAKKKHRYNPKGEIERLDFEWQGIKAGVVVPCGAPGPRLSRNSTAFAIQIIWASDVM